MNLLDFFKRFSRRHIISFSKYTFIGLIASLLNIFLIWLLIDILNIETIIASIIVVVLVFFIKFYSYIYVNLIKKKMVRFLLVQITSAILNIIFTWVLIDIVLLPAIIASTMVVAVLFLLRFLLFYTFRIIKE